MKTLFLIAITFVLNLTLLAQIPAVKIGNQIWMKNNINVGVTIPATQSQTNNNIIEKYCYNNDTNNCNVYGGLYQWAEAVKYQDGVTAGTHWSSQPTMVQGICPDGWHIPSKEEFASLISYLGGMNVAGGKMKEVGKTHWGPLSNIGATNESDFTALPSGAALNGKFSNIRQYGNMWTTTKGTLPRAAWFFGETFAASNIVSNEQNKLAAQAVRCIKDNSIMDTIVSEKPIDYGNIPVLIAPKMSVSTSIFVVPITVKNFKAVSNGAIFFDFDPKVLEVFSMAVNVSHQSMAYNLNSSLASIQFWSYTPMTLPDNSVLFTITFKKKSIGISVIAWEPETAWNNTKSDALHLVNGTLNVQ